MQQWFRVAKAYSNKIVVINEAHTIMPDQIRVIGGEGSYELLNLPESGLTLDKVIPLAEKIKGFHEDGKEIIIASPFPALLAALARLSVPFKIFHNDNRIAKEVKDKDGNVKLVHTVAPDGWVLY